MRGYLYHVCAQSVVPGEGTRITDSFVTRSHRFTEDTQDQAEFRQWFSDRHMGGRSTVFTSITYLGPCVYPKTKQPKEN